MPGNGARRAVRWRLLLPAVLVSFGCASARPSVSGVELTRPRVAEAGRSSPRGNEPDARRATGPCSRGAVPLALLRRSPEPRSEDAPLRSGRADVAYATGVALGLVLVLVVAILAARTRAQRGSGAGVAALDARPSLPEQGGIP